MKGWRDDAHGGGGGGAGGSRPSHPHHGKKRQHIKGHSNIRGDDAATTGMEGFTRMLHDETNIVDHQVILRLPTEVADKLNERIKTSQDGKQLGLSLRPTGKQQGREFDLIFDRQMYGGLLVDLPCYMETYKTNDGGENLYKSGDVAQMMIVYQRPPPGSNTDPLADLKRTQQLNVNDYTFNSGLTPGTHRIRMRKFRGDCAYSPSEMREMEDAILMYLEHQSCDIYEEEWVSEYQRNEHQKNAAADEILETSAQDFAEAKSDASDLSDTLFGLKGAKVVAFAGRPGSKPKVKAKGKPKKKPAKVAGRIAALPLQQQPSDDIIEQDGPYPSGAAYRSAPSMAPPPPLQHPSEPVDAAVFTDSSREDETESRREKRKKKKKKRKKDRDRDRQDK